MKLPRLIGLACVLAACGGDSVTETNAVVGAWALQTVNGAALPYADPFPAPPVTKHEILNDLITFEPGGTYTEAALKRTTVSGGQVTTFTVADRGTWAQNGKQLSLLSTQTGASEIGTLDGNTLTIIGQLTFVYRKQ